MFKKNVLTGFLLIFHAIGFSQGLFNLPKTSHTRINFEIIDNLIIFPVEVNGVKLSFILDSGVSKPILFNIINISGSIEFKHAERIYLRGFGDGGYIEALKSKGNFFKIGDAVNVNQDIFVIFDETINFTPRLGVPVHGIIGYDVFKDFVVEINYASKFMKLHDPQAYKFKNCKKCQTFDLEFNQNKPYINAQVEVNSVQIPVKLLIDSGGSDALWLFQDDTLGIVPGNNYFDDFLGKGLSGSVYGKRARVASFSLDNFHLKAVNAAYPDSAAISFARRFKERNGSVAGEILKRFNMIVDYKNEKITLKKNKNFKLPFQYNMSGIVIEQDGVRVVKERDVGNAGIDSYRNSTEGNKIIQITEAYRYLLKPSYRVVELRKDSSAELAGMQIGDIILSVNNKEAHLMTMQDINDKLRANEGEIVRLKVDRNGKELSFTFKLKSLL